MKEQNKATGLLILVTTAGVATLAGLVAALLILGWATLATWADGKRINDEVVSQDGYIHVIDDKIVVISEEDTLKFKILYDIINAETDTKVEDDIENACLFFIHKYTPIYEPNTFFHGDSFDSVGEIDPDKLPKDVCIHMVGE